jgi:hypothetical protein
MLVFSVIFTVSGQTIVPDLNIQEVFKNYGNSSISPGYPFETLYGSTYIAGDTNRFYITTLPNAHIYKINLSTYQIETDYGAAGYTSVYDLKSGGSITNDGAYIIGVTSLNAGLFYVHKDSTNNSIHSLGYQYFTNARIDVLCSPVYDDETGYVFAGVSQLDGYAKLLKWNFRSNKAFYTTLSLPAGNSVGATNHLYLGQYPVDDLASDDNNISDKTTSYHRALYFNLVYPNINKVGIYDVEMDTWIKFIDISSYIGNNLPYNIVVNGDKLFIFRVKNYDTALGEVIRINTVTNTIEDRHDIPNWGHLYATAFSVKNNKIYTHSHVIDCNTLIPTAYGNGNFIDSRNIVVTNNAIVGAYSPESSLPKQLIKIDLNNISNSFTQVSLSEPNISDLKPPTGGNLIEGFAVGSSNIYASLFWNGIEQRGIGNNWSIYSVMKSQADEIFIDSTFRLYGLYSAPNLRIVSGGIDSIIPLQPYIQDDYQVRITKILKISDSSDYKQYLLGTGQSAYVADNYAKILLLKLKYTNGVLSYSIRKIATVQIASIVDLEFLNVDPANWHYRIFGTEGNHAFVFDYSYNNAPVIVNQFASGNYDSGGMLRIGNLLYVGGGARHGLWVYNIDSIHTATDFYNFSHGTYYDSIFGGYPGKLILGNNGYVYGYYNDHVFCFNPNYIIVNRQPNVKDCIIPLPSLPGLTSDNRLGLKITDMAKDVLTSSNKNIYVSTRVGRIYSISHNTGSVIQDKANYLDQNFPNPFNPTTNIKFKITSNCNVKIRVYDILGKLVSTLVDEEKAPGEYSVTFDGSKLSSGVYFYQLHTGNQICTKKFILMK